MTRTRKNPDPTFSGTGMSGYGYGSVILTRGLPGIFTSTNWASSLSLFAEMTLSVSQSGGLKTLNLKMHLRATLATRHVLEKHHLTRVQSVVHPGEMCGTSTGFIFLGQSL